MDEEQDTLSILVGELGRLLAPLEEALSNVDNFIAFMRLLGWDFALIPAPLQALSAPLNVLRQQVDREQPASLNAGEIIGLIKSIITLVNDLQNAAAGQFPATIDFNEFKNDFPTQLIQFLVVDYLEDTQPLIGYALKTLGIIRENPVPAASLRLPYVRREIAWNDFTQLLDDPLILMKNTYQWGQSSFDIERLTLNLAGLLSGFGLDIQLQRPDPALFSFLTAGNTGLQPYHDWMLAVPLIQDITSAVKTELGVGLYYLPETASAKPGFSLSPYARGNLSTSLDLTETLKFVFEAQANLNGGIAVMVRPDQDVQIVFDIITTSGTGTNLPKEAKFTLSLVNQDRSGEALLLFGSMDGTHLEYKAASLTSGLQLTSGGDPDLFGEAELSEAKLVIKPGSDADSFLAQLLPPDGFSIDVSLAAGISSKQGFYFRGSGGLEIQIPAHIDLGVVEILGAYVAIKPASGVIPLELGGSIKGNLSVMQAVVENIGLRAELTFPPSDGNLGPANLTFGFKPPNGIGLAIDAGVVKGGGYLYLDFDKGEYAGALELTVSDWLSLKAIGLITTKLPGGQPGFSMLIIITAEFNPGFQLGYGFTLIGVGGLVGLNRTMLLDPLVQGVRTGAVNSILFPTNIIANAPKIISDLKTIFPPQEGIFLIGPMAKIGWGTPTLISVALGVIIQIPGNIAILGRLRAALPTEDAAVLVLQVSFVGALEFDKRRLWFFASLFDSRVLFITLEGEMGLLIDFSDTPNFVLSVGGFHPRFKPPAMPFPTPARIALTIINEEYARLRAETYFAITSNTVQIGLSVEAFFGFDSLSVEGYFTFDALLQFSPFYFIVELSAGFSVKVFGAGLFGVHLRGSLEGPTPWHIRGSASIEILFFSISVDVDETFGEHRAETLPPIDVLPQLKAEFEKLDTWRATLPASGALFVSLRELGESEALVLHPVGTLEISQRFAPLNLKLDKIGNQKPADINKATVGVTAGSLAVAGPAKEPFASAQYIQMDDAAKLSAPAFDRLESGVRLSAAGQPWSVGPLAMRNVRYEQIILDTAYKRFRRRFFKFWDGLFTHFRAGAAVSLSPVSLANEKRTRPFAERVAVGPERYTVAYQSDNTAIGGSATFESYAEAQEHLSEAVRLDPGLAEAVHVIPYAETNHSV